MEDDANDSQFQLEEEESTSVKKKKYEYVGESCSTKHNTDDMPRRLQHIRNGLRSVHPEVYNLMLKLKSKYHMSQQQAEAAIVETANYLFDQEWKYYDAEKATDNNTLLAGSNTRRVEPYLEAMALSTIVEEVMKGGKCVVYANDGSAQSADGAQLPLPTFSIFTETHKSLEKLKVMTLRMLITASSYRYTEKQLLERIEFFYR